MSHRLSLSRYNLALSCSYWARGDVECPDDPPGRKARIGTLVHRLVEAHLTSKSFEQQDVDLSELAEAMSIFNGPLKGWIEAWAASPNPRAIELRLRYDSEAHSVRAVPRRGEEGYTSAGPFEVTGEIDLVEVIPGIRADVIDIKTGQKRYVNEEQLRAYAVLAERMWGVPMVRVAFLYARKTKIELTPWTEIDLDALDAEAGRIRRTLRMIPKAEPAPGEHCWRCPLGKANCPAHVTTDWSERVGPELYAEDVRLF